MPGAEPEPFLPPGLYRIQPAMITVSETLYVTAPKIAGEQLTLEEEQPGYERQIWRVKAVGGDDNYSCTIERGDWSHSEYPPTFGLKSEPGDRVSIYCLDGGAENPHNWMISLYNVGNKKFKQPNYAITLPFLQDRGPEYFVDDSRILTLAMFSSFIAHTWYFIKEGENEIAEAKEGEEH